MEPFQNTAQPDWDWWGKLWPTPGATLRRLGLSSGDRLAEVGCGNGYFALPAARITEPAQTYVVDLDDGLLDDLTHLAAQQEIDTIVPLRGDARELSALLDTEVDVVLMANTFHGIDSPETFVREAFDVLAPGGRFVVVNWHDRPREETTVDGAPRGPPTSLRLSPAETEAIVTESTAFSAVDHRELPPYHYGSLFEREAETAER